MPDAASTRSHESFLTLNDDGQRHPLENALAVFTLVTGLVAAFVGTALGFGHGGFWS